MRASIGAIGRQKKGAWLLLLLLLLLLLRVVTPVW